MSVNSDAALCALRAQVAGYLGVRQNSAPHFTCSGTTSSGDNRCSIWSHHFCTGISLFGIVGVRACSGGDDAHADRARDGRLHSRRLFPESCVHSDIRRQDDWSVIGGSSARKKSRASCARRKPLISFLPKTLSMPNRLLETDAQENSRLRRSCSLVAGQLRRYVARERHQ
jgi:hypothetical protein